jgi:hypothetical protein
MHRKLAIAIPLMVVALLASCSDYGSSPTKVGRVGELSVGGVTVAEGSAANFNVTITGVSTSSVTFNWAVTMLSASAGDFSGTLTGTDSILAGATDKIVAVQTADDATSEGSELFKFTISSPVNATIKTGTAGGVISPSDGGVDVSWAGAVSPVLQSVCGTCHPANGGGFSVASPTTLQTTGTHMPNVIPGNGAGSNIIDKLSSSSPSIGGTQMPQGRSPLGIDTINTIKMWIEQGAQNN